MAARKTKLGKRQAAMVDPRKAKPAHGLHVRVNSYELEQLQAAALDEDTSLQRLLRRLVRSYIEKREA
jgi:hypothetical protein